MRSHINQPTQVDTARFVRAILERNRRPDAQLEDLVIQYTCHDSIGRLDPSDELVPWTATLELPFYDEDGVTTHNLAAGGDTAGRDGSTVGTQRRNPRFYLRGRPRR